MSELEVCWTPAMETAAARARQQDPAPLKARRPAKIATEIVAACIEDNPSATMRRIHEITGLSMQHVNAALYQLLKNGRVTRSHRQLDDRLRPVQWRIRS